MKFSAKEDIEAPIEHVFGAISDFDGLERQALRRGAEVKRNDAHGAPGVGSEWEIRFEYRGKDREVWSRVIAFDPPNGWATESRAGGLEGGLKVDLVALSPRRTRIHAVLEFEPKTLSARLLVQSLKFAKGNLNKRYAKRLGQFAKMVEARYTERT